MSGKRLRPLAGDSLSCRPHISVSLFKHSKTIQSLGKTKQKNTFHDFSVCLFDSQGIWMSNRFTSRGKSSMAGRSVGKCGGGRVGKRGNVVSPFDTL